LRITDKIIKLESDFKFILLSGKKNLINDWVNTHQENLKNLNNITLKELLLTEDLDLIKKFVLDPIKIPELIDWTIDMDLLEVSAYLKSIK
jgi:hypothetical protein